MRHARVMRPRGWTTASRAAMGKDSPAAAALAEELKEDLWNGRVDAVIATLRTHRDRRGPPQADDGPQHPRRVLTNNIAYFTGHQHHMNYPECRRKGWPIGSGMTEGGVKQFNNRVKGTEQFWSQDGVEVILALRAPWLSRDDRWNRYWHTRPACSKAA